MPWFGYRKVWQKIQSGISSQSKIWYFFQIYLGKSKIRLLSHDRMGHHHWWFTNIYWNGLNCAPQILDQLDEPDCVYPWFWVWEKDKAPPIQSRSHVCVWLSVFLIGIWWVHLMAWIGGLFWCLWSPLEWVGGLFPVWGEVLLHRGQNGGEVLPILPALITPIFGHSWKKTADI